MTQDKKDINKKGDKPDNALQKPDPETLDKTDPQEKMEGPVSTLMHKGGKIMESDVSKEDADKKHKENL